MKTTPPASARRVLIADDEPHLLNFIAAIMRSMGFEITPAHNGREALLRLAEQPSDLILSDMHMPELGGLELCRQVRQHATWREIPFILITAATSEREIAAGFEAGADDYISKPVKILEVEARVRTMMRIHDARKSLCEANERLNELNAGLEKKVDEQVRELERVNRLRRFFSPQIVQTVLSGAEHDLLREHSGVVTVVFLDLRRFSAFAESQSPETVIQTIRRFHGVVGPVIFAHEGTLERFTGDGMMVFLGDPQPMPDHPVRAVRMCLDIQRAADGLRREWLDTGHDMALGIGVASGIAALGLIGFDRRMDYAAIGSVTNLAARICSRAADGQILISRTTHEAIGHEFETSFHGEYAFKGFSARQGVYEVTGTKKQFS